MITDLDLTRLDKQFEVIRNLFKSSDLVFRFDKHGENYTANCAMRATKNTGERTALYLKCSFADKDGKSVTFTQDNEISRFTQVFRGQQPIYVSGGTAPAKESNDSTPPSGADTAPAANTPPMSKAPPQPTSKTKPTPATGSFLTN